MDLDEAGPQISLNIPQIEYYNLQNNIRKVNEGEVALEKQDRLTSSRGSKRPRSTSSPPSPSSERNFASLSSAQNTSKSNSNSTKESSDVVSKEGASGGEGNSVAALRTPKPPSMKFAQIISCIQVPLPHHLLLHFTSTHHLLLLFVFP